MLRRKCAILAALTMAIAVLAGPALARPPLFAATAPDTAEDLGRKGNALSREGKLPEAIEAYTAALKRGPSYAVAANLGVVELKLGQHRSAAEHLELAQRLAPTDAKPAVTAALAKALSEARSHLGPLRIRVSPVDAHVELDGVLIGSGTAAAERYVEPGVHQVAVARDGYLTRRKWVEVKAGEPLEVVLTLAARAAVEPLLAPAAPPPVLEAPAGRAGVRAPLMIAGASGAVAGLVAGALCTVAANDKAARFTGASAGPEIKQLVASKSAFSDAAAGAFIAAGLLAYGTGVAALWPVLTGPRSSTAIIQLVPLAGPGFGGVGAVATF
jgi:hypothetical protein